ncbi:MAG: hypothetical protein NTW06_01420, partial [Candidatus Falkowbacteria bacterium]|nr:hypothetical protein [Candidatus Falkowbacteria bacterium]
MDKQKNGNKWHIYLILGGFLVEIMRFLYKKIKPNQLKSNLGNFFKEEKREVKELRTGQESLRKFCHDSCSLVVDYFIPHECNSYKPKIL